MKNDSVSVGGSLQRLRLSVNGIVQGVGFRPFVYQTAHLNGLTGTVRNTSEGVEIDIQGARESLENFISCLIKNPPPLARIIDFRQEELAPGVFSGFSILGSTDSNSHLAGIAPDISICPDCTRELFDPADRRYRYPFINCTNCGPRFTIISAIPYDRPFTTMGVFPMCLACEAEYREPSNRRFHAQPNACHTCGPHVTLFDHQGMPNAERDEAVRRTAGFLKDGAIIAVKGLGGFHLICNAFDDKAVRILRERKRREEKPLAMMAFSLEDIDRFAVRTEEETLLLQSPERPIVLLKKRPENPLAGSIAPNNKEYGVMLAYAPLHLLILSDSIRLIVATSGNVSEEPIARDNDEAMQKLGGIADYFLVHNRKILARNDDSVARSIGKRTSIIRRARGYVPLPVMLPEIFPDALGCGGELKNSFCLIKRDRAYLSQHTGDLENLQAYEHYREVHRHFLSILDIKPDMVAHDMHPDYFTTTFAQESYKDSELYPVQHHFAHMVSCMAENRIKTPVIGIILDGTGYGTDGAIWGGEVLFGDWGSYERFAHLEYIPMPGGEKAIKEPWRMALAYLYHAYRGNLRDMRIPFLDEIEKNMMNLMFAMMYRGINCPRTSSCGRLFDGVAALLGIRRENRFEGQAAMELEQNLPEETVTSNYSIESAWETPQNAIPLGGLIRQIIDDQKSGESIGRISAKFHNTISTVYSQAALYLGKTMNLDTVALSGGCFQNAYLYARIKELCNAGGLRVIGHSTVPPNDGGISLGQAVAAAVWKKKKMGNH